MVGCSEKTEAFDDENIIFEVNTNSNDELQSNTIKITNETGYDLENLSLKISYPLDVINSNNSNAERETFKFMEDLKIKSTETKEFSIPFVLKEGIEAGDLEIDFDGSVVEENEKVPFKIAGSLSALVEHS
ncbi:hypothetical protein [Virgibacillus kimchii]